MPEGILVTGASGFVGGQLITRLAAQPSALVRGAVRAKLEGDHSVLITVGEINADTDWAEALQGQRVIVHAAARAHIMDDGAVDPLAEFREVNVAGTLNLARQAAAAAVRRFIFISSIKVNGEQSPPGGCFKADDLPAPEDPYAISKWEAEQGLQRIALETGMEVVIIRPPLVYGPGVKGNFASMARIIAKRLPLPLGAVHNKRSLVALDNLIDLIVTCIHHPSAANQVFLAGDGEDLSTCELLRRVGEAMGRKARLLPLPVALLQLGLSVIGKGAIAQRLVGSLQVDISKTRDVLDWKPPISVDEGLRRCFSNSQDG
ncbi:UDP-glucose 4-epimerase family protein [Marinobacter koreensis]|uniref:UDP-glucose 4-epimerase family protein n=1 Tax=Marinobacter koreensis TaxID=335974 RepID=A0ABW0RJK3_9GAMM|nr:SDR family oxidoreductase [Marinobacter koreensis]MCK7546995.1 SDR family oxidoreductase [Marinobacter koreensis]